MSEPLGLNASVSLGRRRPPVDPYADEPATAPTLPGRDEIHRANAHPCCGPSGLAAALSVTRGMTDEDAEAFMEGFRNYQHES